VYLVSADHLRQRKADFCRAHGAGHGQQHMSAGV
jgi:hypothetical protein